MRSLTLTSMRGALHHYLERWIDDLSDRAGRFNRSHTMLLLFLDWLHINPFIRQAMLGENAGPRFE
jgi:hypothetical protein